MVKVLGLIVAVVGPAVLWALRQELRAWFDRWVMERKRRRSKDSFGE